MDYDKLVQRAREVDFTGDYVVTRTQLADAIVQLQALVAELQRLLAADKSANRLYRAINHLDEDDYDRRAEPFVVSYLDGLSVGPNNRNSVRAALADHFADIGQRAERAEAELAASRSAHGTTTTLLKQALDDLAAARAPLRDAKKYVPAQLGNDILAAPAAKDAP
jgi:hypothetical protein